MSSAEGSAWVDAVFDKVEYDRGEPERKRVARRAEKEAEREALIAAAEGKKKKKQQKKSHAVLTVDDDIPLTDEEKERRRAAIRFVAGCIMRNGGLLDAVTTTVSGNADLLDVLVRAHGKRALPLKKAISKDDDHRDNDPSKANLGWGQLSNSSTSYWAVLMRRLVWIGSSNRLRAFEPHRTAVLDIGHGYGLFLAQLQVEAPGIWCLGVELAASKVYIGAASWLEMSGYDATAGTGIRMKSAESRREDVEALMGNIKLVAGDAYNGPTSLANLPLPEGATLDFLMSFDVLTAPVYDPGTVITTEKSKFAVLQKMRLGLWAARERWAVLTSFMPPDAFQVDSNIDYSLDKDGIDTKAKIVEFTGIRFLMRTRGETPGEADDDWHLHRVDPENTVVQTLYHKNLEIRLPNGRKDSNCTFQRNIRPAPGEHDMATADDYWAYLYVNPNLSAAAPQRLRDLVAAVKEGAKHVMPKRVYARWKGVPGSNQETWLEPEQHKTKKALEPPLLIGEEDYLADFDKEAFGGDGPSKPRKRRASQVKASRLPPPSLPDVEAEEEEAVKAEEAKEASEAEEESLMNAADLVFFDVGLL